MAKFTLSLSGPSFNIPIGIRKLPFDYTSRYQIIAETIHQYYEGKKDIKILDVGGAGGPLAKILPFGEVTIFDPEAKPNDEKYLVGSGASMSDLADNSYDAVITSDTLEHIPKKERHQFISELCRVSADLVVLCAPWLSEKTRANEKNTQEFYKSVKGESHRWLDEHEMFGLPTVESIKSDFRDQDINFIDFYHSSADLWSELIKANLLAYEWPQLNVLKEISKINEFYNENILFKDFSDSGYRIFVVASKKNEVVFNNKSKIPAEAMVKIKDYLNDFYREVITHADELPQIKQKNDELKAKADSLQGDLNYMNHEYQRVINSKSWRYLEPARSVRRRIKSNNGK